MKLKLDTMTLSSQKNTCLIIGLFEGGPMTNSATVIDKANRGYLTELFKQGLYQGKIGQNLPVFQPTAEYPSLLLVGCGKVKSFSMATLRKVMKGAMKTLMMMDIAHANCLLGEIEIANHAMPSKIKQLAEAIHEGLYRFDLFKTEKEPELKLQELMIHLADKKQQKDCELALKQGDAIGRGVAFTKNLANLPSNICTPTFLEEQAKALAKTYPAISTHILDEKQMEKLGMGALLAVAQGSREPAKLICLEYKGTSKKEAPIALVGKGVTFDTGGNSLKPADSMVGMKYDMCGAATVSGTIKIVAALQLPINIVGIVPAVENMPGGSAYKPEDILCSLSGQTIEVISTDAEGRLALCDALTYCERYKPKIVIDIATLTGACVIALGHHASALLSNDDQLTHDLLAAGEKSSDRAWRLPLWDEYQEQIKSPFADMANAGGRSAGTITAACFLSRFTKKFRWAHFDVAGTAAMMSGTSERQATGRPVPLLVQYLIDQS